MSDSKKLSGRCLCGAVGMTPANVSDKIGACHCGTCRKWGAGPYMSIDCGTDVSFDGEINLTIFDSSEWAQRGFCKSCGTHLYYKLKTTGQYFASAAIFGDDRALSFEHQVFIDEKPSYYSFADDTENMTGAELFAKYSSGQQGSEQDQT